MPVRGVLAEAHVRQQQQLGEAPAQLVQRALHDAVVRPRAGALVVLVVGNAEEDHRLDAEADELLGLAHDVVDARSGRAAASSSLRRVSGPTKSGMTNWSRSSRVSRTRSRSGAVRRSRRRRVTGNVLTLEAYARVIQTTPVGRVRTALAAGIVALVLACGSPAGARDAATKCQLGRVSGTYAASVRHALRAGHDVWGEQLLRSRDGPTYNARRATPHPALLRRRAARAIASATPASTTSPSRGRRSSARRRSHCTSPTAARSTPAARTARS